MYKYCLLLLGTVGALASCRKTEPQNPESVFYFNDIEVKTREFQAYSFNGKTELDCSGYVVNGEYLSIGIGFNFGDFPFDDTLDVSYGGPYTYQCNIGFHWHDTQYLVDRHNATSLYALTHTNGKAKYVLTPTWFYSQIPDSNSNGFIPGNDSILVQGTFYESNDVVIR
ncbi:hypothetical protein D3C72_763590 [compost metagenome]